MVHMEGEELGTQRPCHLRHGVVRGRLGVAEGRDAKPGRNVDRLENCVVRRRDRLDACVLHEAPCFVAVGQSGLRHRVGKGSFVAGRVGLVQRLSGQRRDHAP